MACQPAANTPSNANANAGNANANVAAKPAPPTKEALTALEEKAFDAWTKGDTQFFEGFLVDNFVGFGPDGKQIDKAGTVKMIGTEKCEVKSKSFSDQTVTPVGPDAAVITMKVDADVTCGGKKVPNPMITASLYVRSGDTWKGAYHNEVKYVEPKNVKPEDAKTANTAPAKTASPAKTSSPAASTSPAANTATHAANTSASPAAATGDQLLDALLPLEKSGWEAWKARDAKKLGDITASDLSFVDTMGHVAATKADTLKAWTEPNCDIKSVDVSNAKATSITKDVAILTYKGTAVGTCEGEKLGPLWGNSIFVKEGDIWKVAYVFEVPA